MQECFVDNLVFRTLELLSFNELWVFSTLHDVIPFNMCGDAACVAKTEAWIL